MPRLAFISTAHIHTKSFIENIVEASDGRAVAAVWDDVPERGKRYASLAGAPFTADLDSVLADTSIDGFIICAENTRHLPLLQHLLPAGKPVFCEKPLVTSTDDLQVVRSLLKEHPTKLFCGYFQPHAGDMLAARQLVHDGAFGQITRIRIRNAHHAAYGRWFDNPDLAWFTNPKLAGGGAFMDMGTHAIHMARTIFGPVREAWAEIGNHAGEYPECDDFGIAQLRFQNGILGTIEAAWTQTGGIGGLEITGSEASLWNTSDGYVTGSPGKAPEKLRPISPEKPTRVDRLVAVINRRIPEPELTEDLAATMDAVAIMQACYKSADSGQWIEVEGT